MKKFAAAVLILVCSSANATLIASGDQVIDTDTGHSWFKVTETIGYSYNQMLTQFATPGSRYFGYQYATPVEFSTLMHNGGYLSPIPFRGYNYTGGNQAPVAYITKLFGITASADLSFFKQTRIDAWIDTSSYDSPIGLGVLTNEEPTHSIAEYLLNLNGYLTPGAERDATTLWNYFTGYRDVGSWIYQSEPVVTVPEPSSLALLGLGLVGLALRSKRLQS